MLLCPLIDTPFPCPTHFGRSKLVHQWQARPNLNTLPTCALISSVCGRWSLRLEGFVYIHIMNSINAALLNFSAEPSKRLLHKPRHAISSRRAGQPVAAFIAEQIVNSSSFGEAGKIDALYQPLVFDPSSSLYRGSETRVHHPERTASMTSTLLRQRGGVEETEDVDNIGRKKNQINPLIPILHPQQRPGFIISSSETASQTLASHNLAILIVV
ncbi:hypothetical protein EV401DRAFT_835563 [Pisolithus croceorrhizus]|nr:hypothetical protein EV401DRAFT_835563 [Pisolithus croceorrhizus]